MKISLKVVYQYMAIFFTFSPTLNHLHPLQVENGDSNSWLVVDEDDNVNWDVVIIASSTILYPCECETVNPLRTRQFSFTVRWELLVPLFQPHSK